MTSQISQEEWEPKALPFPTSELEHVFSLLKRRKLLKVLRVSGTGSRKNRLNDNIEKRSLEYINETIDDSVKDSKTARNYLSNELESFVTNSKKRDCSPMENSRDSNFHTPVHNNKKTRTETSLDKYVNAINAVNSIQTTQSLPTQTHSGGVF
ncbi:unnamed protein product [Rhizophagus irregularis]|uniref:Uncharacterized protein n=1 Tax=Rhizophagus irregularis TaxID=588596 RepID=A0A915ZZ70_9GLOM|nr:unnamed protein product [Rhizophagus irregularis]